ncbi:MAG: hypothetical protein QNJ67_10855 [Kiloniellales bacterium]|nr:hypothetical protein [Kiloniellales bacterium]
MAQQALPEVVTFRADPGKTTGWRFCFLYCAVACSLIWLGQVAVRHFYHGVPWSSLWASDGNYLLWSGAGYVLFTLLFTAVAAITDQRLLQRVYLRLDREGLTDSRMFKTRRWLWRDLPEFDLEAKQFPPNIAFHWPGQKPDSPRKGMITDGYDAPLPEIVAMLNAFRERALPVNTDSA